MSLLKRPSIYLMPLSCLLFVGCFMYIQDYDGPKLPSSQTAKLYLDRSWWGQYAYRFPVTAEVDGKPHEIYQDPAECLLLLPGEHELKLIAGPYTSNFAQVAVVDVSGSKTRTELVPVDDVPATPNWLIIKFKAEKGGEYLLAQNRPASIYTTAVFWIVEKATKRKITEEYRFEWKR